MPIPIRSTQDPSYTYGHAREAPGAEEEGKAVGLARGTLLWASQNAFMRHRVPRLKFVRRAVLKFMPGETIDAALEAAGRFAKRGLPTTLTYLGENVGTEAEADAVTRHYLEVLDRVRELALDTEISVKLTHLGFDLGQDLARANFDRLAKAAGERTNWVWIDMESSRYVDGTLAVYSKALASSPNVGVCLQAYLHRTDDDLASLLPLSPSIRLVKGAYREPKAVAETTRSGVGDRFLRLSRRMLEAHRDGQMRRIAIATHDMRLIDAIESFARARELPKDAYEIQMLYGIRQPDQFRLSESGRPTRALIAYGPAWYPWYMRRLAEKPSNVWFVVRNLIG
jgi:proline dehydrogenase